MLPDEIIIQEKPGINMLSLAGKITIMTAIMQMQSKSDFYPDLH